MGKKNNGLIGAYKGHRLDQTNELGASGGGELVNLAKKGPGHPKFHFNELHFPFQIYLSFQQHPSVFSAVLPSFCSTLSLLDSFSLPSNGP